MVIFCIEHGKEFKLNNRKGLANSTKEAPQMIPVDFF